MRSKIAARLKEIKHEVVENTRKLRSKDERESLMKDVDCWATRQALRVVTPLSRSVRGLEQALLKHSVNISGTSFPKPHLRRVNSDPKRKRRDRMAIELEAQDPDYRGRNASGGQRPARPI